MKTQDTFWYTRENNLRDDLKSNIDRNKSKLFEGIFLQKCQKLKRDMEQN